MLQSIDPVILEELTKAYHADAVLGMYVAAILFILFIVTFILFFKIQDEDYKIFSGITSGFALIIAIGIMAAWFSTLMAPKYSAIQAINNRKVNAQLLP